LKALAAVLANDVIPFLPEIYIKYQYATSEGRFIFCMGINLVTVDSIGIGVKI